MTWDRHLRQEAILKEKIAVIVLERLADPRLGFVTITDVELSRDKRHATVSYTCFGTEAQRRTTERALAAGAPRVQELLAPSLEMRLIPQLRFVHDDGVQKESRLLKLIEEVTAERVEREGPDAALPDPVSGEEAGGALGGGPGGRGELPGDGSADALASGEDGPPAVPDEELPRAVTGNEAGGGDETADDQDPEAGERVDDGALGDEAPARARADDDPDGPRPSP